MKYILIVLQILILYGLYYIGIILQRHLELTIPGSIIGMILLFLLLQFKIIKERWLLQGANFLLAHFALLFVPATVGIMEYLPFLKGDGFITIFIALISTILVMLSSGLIGQAIARRQKMNKILQHKGRRLGG